MPRSPTALHVQVGECAGHSMCGVRVVSSLLFFVFLAEGMIKWVECVRVLQPER